MDNLSIANLLVETADLLEISAGDPFRIRLLSPRRRSRRVHHTPPRSPKLAAEDPKKTSSKSPASAKAHSRLPTFRRSKRPEPSPTRRAPPRGIQSLYARAPQAPRHGSQIRRPLLGSPCRSPTSTSSKPPSPPASSPNSPLRRKAAEKLKKGIAEYRKNSGRFHLDDAEQAAEKITTYLLEFPGITTVTPAGSLRRGRDTVGDLDLLATGPICDEDKVAPAVEYMAAYPPINALIAKGANKVSFRLRSGLQVDVRLLPQAGYGAALQYFTGSKMHNVSTRQRALKRGYTLSEYALAKVEDGTFVAGATEEEIYAALGMDWIPPELRENSGELEAALAHSLPKLITQADIRGDVHMHTTATDGRNTIREMAEAALARGYEYIAITDHSKNLAMTNGLDDQRALAHIAAIQEVNSEMEGRIRIFPGIEVDILHDGQLDLTDETLAQMDVVIASVHTLFNQPLEQMTDRVLRALENPHVRILGHPTGRQLLRREAYQIDMARILKAAAAAKVAVEHNANPNRLDLCDRDLRMAKEAGCKIVINTDAHHTTEMENMKYGVRQLRRAWLTKEDTLNTLPPKEFLKALRP